MHLLYEQYTNFISTILFNIGILYLLYLHCIKKEKKNTKRKKNSSIITNYIVVFMPYYNVVIFIFNPFTTL